MIKNIDHFQNVTYPPADDADRRNHQRHAAELAVLISNGARRMNGRIQEYSNGGVKILWLDKFETPTEALLVPQFVNLEISQHFIIPGKVTYIDDTSIGVQFEIEDDELPDVIKEIIANAARKH